DDQSLNSATNGGAQLRDHGAHEDHWHGRRLLVWSRSSVQVTAAQGGLSGSQPIAKVQIEEWRQVLVALDETGKSTRQLGRALGQLIGVGCLDRLLGGEFLGRFRFGYDYAHLSFLLMDNDPLHFELPLRILREHNTLSFG